MAGLEDLWWSAPYTPQASEFTTPGDLRRERIARALGSDPEYPWWNFLVGALTQAPLALRGPVGRQPVAPSVAPATSPAHATIVQEYTRKFGHPPPAEMSSGAMRRWIDGPFSQAPRRPGASSVVEPTPVAEPPAALQSPPASTTPRASSAQIAGARDDLYAMSPYHRVESNMSRWDDHIRAQRFLGALEDFSRAQPPPPNRLNSVAPIGAAGALGLQDPWWRK